MLNIFKELLAEGHMCLMYFRYIRVTMIGNFPPKLMYFSEL